MTVATLNALTQTDWQTFWIPSNRILDTLSFAYALEVVDPKVDVATIQQFDLDVMGASKWVKQAQTDVEIAWYPTGVSFTPKNEGNYRFGYQVP